METHLPSKKKKKKESRKWGLVEGNSGPGRGAGTPWRGGGVGGKVGAEPSRAERSGAGSPPRPSHFAPTHPGRPHTSARGCVATGGPAAPRPTPRLSPHRTAPQRDAPAAPGADAEPLRGWRTGGWGGRGGAVPSGPPRCAPSDVTSGLPDRRFAASHLPSVPGKFVNNSQPGW